MEGSEACSFGTRCAVSLSVADPDENTDDSDVDSDDGSEEASEEASDDGPDDGSEEASKVSTGGLAVISNVLLANRVSPQKTLAILD
jgi:hypothetical protein